MVAIQTKHQLFVLGFGSVPFFLFDLLSVHLIVLQLYYLQTYGTFAQILIALIAKTGVPVRVLFALLRHQLQLFLLENRLLLAVVADQQCI
jgi:cytochrome c oxidase subunit IV